jgi:dihydroorotate dehydrogenase electron transfer subunit
MRLMHHDACYADRAWWGRVAIEENLAIARDTYRVRIRAPEIARRIVPGQFLMLRLPECNDPLLGRPLALYDTGLDSAGAPVGVDIVYLVIGRMTRRLARLPAGASLEVWGPLGNGFPPTETEHLVMVGGGIGQTPLLALAREYSGLRCYGDPGRKVAPAKKITLCYGTRSADLLAGVDDFRALGIEVVLSTDDGSAGHHGLVTDLIRPVVSRSDLTCRIVCCGPEPMMESTAHIARELGVPCQVSLESPMACGVGICFSCVAKVREESGEWDYRRTCVEGPVFDAERIEF